MKKRAAAARGKKAVKRSGRRWSRQVTEHSNALTLQKGVFTKRSPKDIAASLKRSAERSKRRKTDPYRSALSMLTFYINRAGRKLPASRKRTLIRAKDELPPIRSRLEADLAQDKRDLKNGIIILFL